MLWHILSICPALLLCLYPTRAYEKVSKYCSARKQLAVKTFAEAFHSCFKNGLNGISFSLSYLRLCKSLIMNVSLSFHIMLFGTLAITTGLWYEGIFFSTEALAVTFVVLIVLPHNIDVDMSYISALCELSLWALYCKTVLTMLHRAAPLLHKKSDYQELCDWLINNGTKKAVCLVVVTCTSHNQ